MAEAGAESKLAGSSIETATAAPGTRKKTVRVKLEYVNALLARRPIKPFPFISEECIQLQDPKQQEKTRARQARIATLIKKARDKEEDILEQYCVKGYADMEVKDVDEEGGMAMGN